MKFKDSERIQEILMEMPQWASPIGNNTFNDLSRMTIESLRSDTRQVSINGEFEIRRAEDYDKNTIMFFIVSDVLVAGYSFKPYPNYIKTLKSWSNPKYKGSFYKTFIGYIIPMFGRIESDNLLTQMGYDFWEKLITNHPNLYFYVKVGNDYNQITTPSELSNYYGKSSDFSNSTFVVSKNPI